MDIGLREWLIIIGIIVIAAILFDGWRRIRGGKNKLRLDKNMNYYNDNIPQQTNKPIEDLPLSEKGKKEPTLSAAEDVTLKAEQQFTLTLEAEDKKTSAKPSQNEKNTTDDVESKQHPIEKVLVINVVSNHPEGFKGPALLQNILESGLRFGEMDIFHRHESMTGNGERYFSMANGVKPGTFNLDDIDHFTTRAVSFFLGLPGPKHPKRAFDVMLAAARKLSSELDGRLLDDQHSVITAQTIEHYRQRIVEFERQKLTKKK